MKLQIEKDYAALSHSTALAIIDQVKRKPGSVLCLAAGDTPRLAYTLLSELAKKDKVDFSRCSFAGLDEWVGIPPENEGSCQYFLRTLLFGPLNIQDDQVHVFNALSVDLSKECTDMDRFIRDKGGIDLMVVGVGRNGHIGFNEPGVDFNRHSHVIDLDDTTQSVGQKYFKENTSLKKGITLGLKHLLEARSAIMIANGIKKAEVIKSALEGEITNQMPASIMRRHQNGEVIIDEQAGSLLKHTQLK
jgi:glucosamine-6-phosphate isomerase